MNAPFIRVIDFETTGTEPPAAQVCEVGYTDYTPTTGHISAPVSWLCSVDSMPPDVRAVHHIKLTDCAGQPRFDPVSLLDQAPAAFAAHNAAYECQFLPPQPRMICTYKAALRVWPDAPSHKNGVLRYWLEDQSLIAPLDKLTHPAHRAGPDSYVTAHILKALFAAGATGSDMLAWTREPALLPNCPLGKFRGKPWAEVETGFLQWMLKQADMADDLKWNAKQEIKRRETAQ